MKMIKLLIALVLLGVAGLGTAWADRGHNGGRVHLGVMIGQGWGPWYYPPSYYYPPYYPPVIVQPQQPQVYIEQQQAPGAAAGPVTTAPANYWYYCAAARGYYPYVKECPGGWQKVLPQPPEQP